MMAFLKRHRIADWLRGAWRRGVQLFGDGETAFGKPGWFRRERGFWGLTPVGWPGRLYFTVWGAVIAGPSLALLGNERGLEAVIWALLAFALLIRDTRLVRLAADEQPGATGRVAGSAWAPFRRG